ncbi:MAG: hypothetical protein Q8903_00750 [Bacteroidota bacterium]|nr:hypothetical protein [Bacteroidota bacterium]
MKPLFISLLLVFCITITTYSNDCAVSGQGGRWQLLKGEHNSIQMISEIVNMSVFMENSGAEGELRYKVVATFIFKNHGKAQTVKMGFPESSYGDYDGGFLYFHTWVNGQEVTASRSIIDSSAGDSSAITPFNPDSSDYEDGFDAFWVKDVSFNENETKTITVEYMSPVNNGIAVLGNGTDYWVSYDFTGGNWFGKVEESKVIVEIPIKYKILSAGIYDDSEEKKLANFSKTKLNDKYILTSTIKDWQAEGKLNIKFKDKR